MNQFTRAQGHTGTLACFSIWENESVNKATQARDVALISNDTSAQLLVRNAEVANVYHSEAQCRLRIRNDRLSIQDLILLGQPLTVWRHCRSIVLLFVTVIVRVRGNCK